jgi:outer membrane protein OmpA-like peptidoglycan-associated protein
MKSQISFLALEIELVGYNKVSLTGYSDATGTTGENTTLSLHRARVVKTYLLTQLHTLGVGGVTITAVGKGATHFLKGNGKLAGNRRVVAVLS